MEQKIKVEVIPAANDQWPKVINTMDEFPEGATHFVDQLNGGIIAAYFIVHTDQYNRFMQKEWEGTKPGQVICFNDGDALCRWWLNPQPVNEEPEMVPIKSLKAGNFFVAGDEIFLRSNCQHNPSVINAGSSMAFPDNHLVTPFKGRITIDVE
jgi:hypothetical protein